MTDIQRRMLGEHDVDDRERIPLSDKQHLAELRDRLGPVAMRPRQGAVLTKAESMALARDLSADWAREHGITPPVKEDGSTS